MEECSLFAISLRKLPETWSDSLEDFRVYWNSNLEKLEVTDWVHERMHQTLWAKMLCI